MTDAAPYYDTIEGMQGGDIDRSLIIDHMYELVNTLTGDSTQTVEEFRSLYEHMDDVDLFSDYQGMVEAVERQGSEVDSVLDSQNITVSGDTITAHDIDGNPVAIGNVDFDMVMASLDRIANGEADASDIAIVAQSGKDVTFNATQRQQLEDKYREANPSIDIEEGTSALQLAHMISKGESAESLYNETALAQTFGDWTSATGKGASSRGVAEWYEHESMTLFDQVRENGYIIAADGEKLDIDLQTLNQMQSDPDFMGNTLTDEDAQKAVQEFRNSQERLELDMREQLFQQDPLFRAMSDQGMMNPLVFGGIKAKGGYFQMDGAGFAGASGLHFGSMTPGQQQTLFSSWWDQGGAEELQAKYNQFDTVARADVSGTYNRTQAEAAAAGVGSSLFPAVPETATRDWFTDERGAPTQAALSVMEMHMADNPMVARSIGQEWENTFDDTTFSSPVTWGDGTSVGQRNILVEGEAKQIALTQGYAPGNIGQNWEEIMKVSARYNVPWQVLLGAMDLKRGQYDFTDPIADATAIAMSIQEGLITYGSMALSLWALEDPIGASQMAQYGDANPQSKAIGQQVIRQILGAASQMLYDDPWATAEAQFIGAMSDRETQVRLTDPAEIREAMIATYNALLLPAPSEAAMASQIAAIHSAESQSQAPLPTESYSQSKFNELRQYSLSPQDWYYPIVGESDYSNSYGYDGGRSARGYVHGGIDIYAKGGSAVVAPVNGSIKSASYTNGAAGIHVQVQGDDGKVYVFSHMNTWNVEKGQRVSGGQQIGTVGNTGSASGGSTHLHFEVHRNGKYNRQSLNPDASGRENPFPYLDATKASGNTLITGAWDLPSLYAATTDYGIKGDTTIERIMVNPMARISEKMRGTQLYKQLYRNKPIGVTDTTYASNFLNQAQAMTGEVPAETARIGIESGSLETMFGHAFGSTEQQKSSSKFRDRLYRVSRAFNTAKVNR